MLKFFINTLKFAPYLQEKIGGPYENQPEKNIIVFCIDISSLCLDDAVILRG